MSELLNNEALDTGDWEIDNSLSENLVTTAIIPHSLQGTCEFQVTLATCGNETFWQIYEISFRLKGRG